MHKRTLTSAEWAILEVHCPGKRAEAIGVFVRDMKRNEIYMKSKPGWWALLPESVTPELWCQLFLDLAEKSRYLGADRMLEWLETSASHMFRLTDRQRLDVQDIADSVDALYSRYIEMKGLERPIVKPPTQNWTQSELLFRAGQAGRSSIGNWYRLAAAAGMLLAFPFLRTGWKNEDSYLRVRSMSASNIVLPIQAGLQYRPTLVMTDFTRHRSPIRHTHSTRGKARTSRPKPFRPPAHEVVWARARRVPVPVEPPQMDIRAADIPTLLIPASVPKAPRFRRSRNRFVRVLAAVVVPLRLLAKS